MEQQGLLKHWEKIYCIQENDFRARSLEALIIRHLKPESEILDLGCGTCGLTLSLLREGFKVTSVDSSDEMLKMGKEILANNGFSPDRVISSDITSFSASNKAKFDQVICLDVIEHIENDAEALLAINSLIKNEGQLILTVPAHPCLYGPKDMELGHYRRYSKKELLGKLHHAKFRVETQRYWNFVGAVITWIFIKVFKRRVGESFRYKNESIKSQILKWYFTLFENNISFPFGLTLLVTAEKLAKYD